MTGVLKTVGNEGVFSKDGGTLGANTLREIDGVLMIESRYRWYESMIK